MTPLLPYYLLSGVAAAVLTACSGLSGWALLLCFVLSFVGALLELLLLTLLLIALSSLLIDPNKPQTQRCPAACRVVTFVLGLLTAFGRIRLHVEGTELLPEGRWLLVCNHRSNYDPIVTGWALRRHELAFISKPQNMRIPVVGRYIHKANYLGIDREDDRAALRTIITAAQLLSRDVTNFCVYPEGTRNPTAELLPFRNGAFKIAQKAGVPIVVAVIRGTDDVRKRFPWKHTDVYLKICTVLDAETVKQKKTNEIGDEVRAWISSESF